MDQEVDCMLMWMVVMIPTRSLIQLPSLHPSLPPGIYSSWGDYECRHDHYKPPSLHIAQFQSQLEEALSLGPVHVNSHTGCDAWREEKDVIPFFEMVLEAQKAMGSEVGRVGRRGDERESTCD